MDLLDSMSEALQRGDDGAVREGARKAVEMGLPPGTILDRGLIAGMAIVGERFRAREMFLPEVLLAARAMQAGLAILEPLLVKGAVPSRGTVVIGTVRGDLHDIGKNLVGVMLKGAGFKVVDLGRDVAPEAFVENAVTHEALAIGMSALLTTTMVGMKDVVDLLERRGLRGRIKTIVGGAPVSAEFAREIGADAFAFDAASAVERVQGLAAES